MADPRGFFRSGSSPLVPQADRRRQLVAFAIISGLVLVAFGLWFVAILTSSDRDQFEIAEGPPRAEEGPVGEREPEEGDDDPDDRVAGDEDVEEPEPEEPQPEAPEGTTPERSDPEPDTDDETESGPGDETDPEPDTRSDDGSRSEDDTDPEPDTDEADTSSEDETTGETDPNPDIDDDTDSEPDTDDDTDAEDDPGPEPDTGDDADAENPDDTEVVSVTIDEVCTVEVDAEEADAASLQAWDYADCAYAPVPLDDGAERWIVVRASMPSGDVDAAAAQERASDLGVDGGVLWSSHYPSLSPGFWVAYDGPFPDVEAARSAAETADGDAYARALAADDGAG